MNKLRLTLGRWDNLFTKKRIAFFFLLFFMAWPCLTIIIVGWFKILPIEEELHGGSGRIIEVTRGQKKWIGTLESAKYRLNWDAVGCVDILVECHGVCYPSYQESPDYSYEANMVYGFSPWQLKQIRFKEN